MENNAAQPKKSNMMMFIIIGLLVVILGLGGFFGYTMFIKKDDEAQNNAKKQAVKATVIYSLKSFIVNLMDKSGVGKRYLKLTMELEIESEKSRTMIDGMKPQVRDAILLMLSSQTIKEINSVEGKLALKQRIIESLNGIFGETIIHRIYFTEFVVQ